MYRFQLREASGSWLLGGDAITSLIPANRDPTDRNIIATSTTGASEQTGRGEPHDAASRIAPLSWSDRLIVSIGGIFAGLVGIAIGEISNTFLTVRKQIPIKLSTGTSALALHLTILSALVTNLLVLGIDPPIINAEDLVIPWTIRRFLLQ